MNPNALYAQSGGVTAVINQTAMGVLDGVRSHLPDARLYAGLEGISGILEGRLKDVTDYSAHQRRLIAQTPGGIFGSCRKKLGQNDTQVYEAFLDQCRRYKIGYFFYNGGGDSQGTIHQISNYAQSIGFPIQCIGIPKTIDNDLPSTDTCPGFGSVAKFIAISTRETSLDLASMCGTSTQVFILETMGRHTGWITASAGLAFPSCPHDQPYLVLCPEVAFDMDRWIAELDRCVKKFGYCSVIASEGIRHPEGHLICQDQQQKDAFGHIQLGGVGYWLAQSIQSRLHYKCHVAVADYLQRAARHVASQTDVQQAYAVGFEAVHFAAKKKANAVMTAIVRDADEPYAWHIETVGLEEVASVERWMPRSYLDESGFRITSEARRYLSPLIQGEAYPTYVNGLPEYMAKTEIYED